MQQQRSVSVFVQSHFFNLKQSIAAISANRNTECASLFGFLLRDPQQSTLPGRQSCVVERLIWQSFERSCSLDDFEASTIENAAAVSNLDNIAMCFCRGHCLRERETTFVSARAMKGISGNT